MCKHVAAALYGVGARLDHKPELLFLLRAVDGNDLIANLNMGLPMAGKEPASGKILEGDDLSALFGIDMDGPAGDPPVAAVTGVKKPEPKQAAARKSKPPTSKRTGPKQPANAVVKARAKAKNAPR
jgi:uncharacterized Zn finger protein